MHTVISLGPYGGRLRHLAHKVKDGNGEALEEAAGLLAPVILQRFPDAVLIPTPGHDGKESHTHRLCRLLSEKTGRPVCEALSCLPHTRMYGLKVRERDLGLPKGTFLMSPSDLRMFRTEAPLPEGVPVIVDNVFASGTTAAAALEALGNDKAAVLVLAEDTTYPKNENFLKLCNPTKTPEPDRKTSVFPRTKSPQSRTQQQGRT